MPHKISDPTLVTEIEATIREVAGGIVSSVEQQRAQRLVRQFLLAADYEEQHTLLQKMDAMQYDGGVEMPPRLHRKFTWSMRLFLIRHLLTGCECRGF